MRGALTQQRLCAQAEKHMLEQTLGQVLSGQHGGANAAGMPLGQHSPGQVMPISRKAEEWPFLLIAIPF